MNSHLRARAPYAYTPACEPGLLAQVEADVARVLDAHSAERHFFITGCCRATKATSCSSGTASALATAGPNGPRKGKIS